MRCVMTEKDFILIVDDESKLRKSLSDILKSHGYAPEAVPGGKEALEVIKEKKPAVALIDIRMVDMSGIDLMEEIRHQSPETACIVLTGQAPPRGSGCGLSIDERHLGMIVTAHPPAGFDVVLT